MQPSEGNPVHTHADVALFDQEESSTFAKREWEYDSCEEIPQSALESIMERVTEHMAQNPYLRLYLNFELELVGDDVKGAFITELHQFFVDNSHREVSVSYGRKATWRSLTNRDS